MRVCCTSLSELICGGNFCAWKRGGRCPDGVGAGCRGSAAMCKRRRIERSGCPHLLLEDELGRCLCFLDSEPDGYSRVARQWAARLLWELPLSLKDAQWLLFALNSLASAEPPSSMADALLMVLGRHGLSRAARLLRAWQSTWPSGSPGEGL